MQKRPEVWALYLFGSESRGTSQENSDLDLAIMVRPGTDSWTTRLELGADLQDRVARSVDLIVLGDDLELTFRVLKEGRRLYERQRDRVRSREAVLASMYYDYQPFLNSYFQGVAERFREVG